MVPSSTAVIIDEVVSLLDCALCHRLSTRLAPQQTSGSAHALRTMHMYISRCWRAVRWGACSSGCVCSRASGCNGVRPEAPANIWPTLLSPFMCWQVHVSVRGHCPHCCGAARQQALCVCRLRPPDEDEIYAVLEKGGLGGPGGPSGGPYQHQWDRREVSATAAAEPTITTMYHSSVHAVLMQLSMHAAQLKGKCVALHQMWAARQAAQAPAL